MVSTILSSYCEKAIDSLLVVNVHNNNNLLIIKDYI